MVYCNFDTRTKGARSIPTERLAYLRDLEAQVRRDREARRIARLALAKSGKGGGREAISIWERWPGSESGLRD